MRKACSSKAKTLGWCTMRTSFRNFNLCCEFLSPWRVIGQRSTRKGKSRARSVVLESKNNLKRLDTTIYSHVYQNISNLFKVKLWKSHWIYRFVWCYTKGVHDCKNVCKSAVVITKNKIFFFPGVACFVSLKNQLKDQFLWTTNGLWH